MFYRAQTSHFASTVVIGKKTLLSALSLYPRVEISWSAWILMIDSIFIIM